MKLGQKERGSALLIVIIFIVAMTLVVIANMKSTVFQEKSTSAHYDRALAFQAVEASLREAETRLLTRTGFPSEGCVNGFCAAENDLDGQSVALWQDDNADWANAEVKVIDNNGSEIETEAIYLVETMGMSPNWPGCDREVPISPNCMSPNFRITAKTQQEGRSEVVLQASYALPGN